MIKLSRIIFSVVCSGILCLAAEQLEAKEVVKLYDTIQPLEAGTEAASLASRTSWKLLSKSDAGQAIKGDAVIINNDNMATIIGKNGCDLYMKSPKGWASRAQVQPVIGKAAKHFGGLSAASKKEGGGVKAMIEGVDGAALLIFVGTPRFPAIKINRVGKVDGLRYVAPSQLGILPDFYSDDMMIDAKKIPVDQAKIPNDHIFLHLTAGGSAIVAAVWEKGDEDLNVAFEGKGDERKIKHTDVFFSKKGGAMYAAIIEAPSVWFARHMTKEEVLKGGSLDWPVPFSAKWKGNFTLLDGSINSRQFLSKKTQKEMPPLQWVDEIKSKGSKGGYTAIVNPVKSSRFPKGIYEIPEGMLALYPLSRDPRTPLTAYCVSDLLRLMNTEVCSYVLDMDDNNVESRGYFTCAYHSLLPTITPSEYSRNGRAVAEALKEERDYLRFSNDQTNIFIKHIQDRINDYVDFRESLLKYLTEQKKSHPKALNLITKIEKLVNQKVKVFNRTEGPMQRANGVERAKPLLNEVEKAIRIDVPQQALRAVAIGAGIKHIGDPQDNRIRADRMIVMKIRALASMEMAINPAAVEIAKEIRKRSQTVLRGGATHEKALKW